VRGEPSLPLAGGCQCGACRYEIGAPPLAVYACHCTECRRQSGGAFGMSMPVARASLVLTAAAPGTWRRTAASGRGVDCAFCPSCGTRLFHLPQRNASVANVKPGTLDDTSWVRPVAHLWVRSTPAAHRMRLGGLVYDGQPDEFAPVYGAWRALGLFT
jgi:hypothetical protein